MQRKMEWIFTAAFVSDLFDQILETIRDLQISSLSTHRFGELPL